MTTKILTEAIGTGYISPSSWSPAAVPGDTIIIAADRVSGILLKNFNGTPASPYLFTNPSNAKVILSGLGTTDWGEKGIHVFDSDNFKILGNNYSSETYGIEIHGITNPKAGLRMFRCADWEIGYVHVHDTYGGITQNYNDPWTQSNSMGNCRLHHSYIKDVASAAMGSEAVYLGKSSTGDYPHWTQLEIDHLHIENITCDGIQSGQTEKLLIHDNYVQDVGLLYASEPVHAFGIIASAEGGGVDIYGNTIIRSRHNGIEITYSAGVGGCDIHDNVVWDAGHDGKATANGIKINTKSGAPTVINNTVVGAGGYGIKVGGGSTNGEIRYNLLVANGSGGISSAYAIQNDNRIVPSIATENFINASIGNFRLTIGSPAKDSGIGLGYSTTDLDGTTRPIGSAADIGAFEYIEAAISAKGQIVNLDHPVIVEHGAACDINAAIKNIGELSGQFKTQILLDGVLKATSPEFTLAGGATSTDKIKPFTAPLTGESMDIIIKCIRSE